MVKKIIEVSYEDLIRTFNKVASEDESTKQLFNGMPLLQPAITIILTKIFDELTKE